MSDVDNVSRLVTDDEFAADIKKRTEEAMRPVCQIIAEANKRGMVIQWDSIGANYPNGPFQVNNLRVVRFY